MDEPKRSTCTISMIGSMNPALHYPVWYRLRDLIDDEEEQYALKEGQAMLLPPPQPHASFDTGAFSISCNPRFWQIKAVDPENFGRAYRLACTLFDKELPHTPVEEFWIEYDRNFAVEEAVYIKARMAIAQAIPLDIGLAGASLTHLVVSEQRELATAFIEVTAGKDGSSFIVSNNYKFQARQGPVDPYDYWSLSERLGPDIDHLTNESRIRAEAIIASLRRIR